MLSGFFWGGRGAVFAFGFLFICFLLQYNCFTLLCYFLLYNEVYQPYAYTYIPSLLDLPPTQALHFAHPRSSQSAKLRCLCYTWQQLSSYLWTYGASLVAWMVLSQFFPPSPSPSLPCPHIHSLHLHLCSYPANRFICTIFLDSIYMHWYRCFKVFIQCLEVRNYVWNFFLPWTSISYYLCNLQ